MMEVQYGHTASFEEVSEQLQSLKYLYEVAATHIAFDGWHRFRVIPRLRSLREPDPRLDMMMPSSWYIPEEILEDEGPFLDMWRPPFLAIEDRKLEQQEYYSAGKEPVGWHGPIDLGSKVPFPAR